MVILRAFFALLAGFATMVAFIALMNALLKRLVPSWMDEIAGTSKLDYLFVNLGYSFLAAAAGGYVTAWLSAANPLIHVLALSIVVLLLAALSALQQRGEHPVWYMLTLVALTPIGVLAGGFVRLRMLGVF